MIFVVFIDGKADGLPGNDDYGTMSAWYVFGALGFYPLSGNLGSELVNAQHLLFIILDLLFLIKQS